MTNAIKTTLGILVAVMVIGGILWWSNQRDIQVMIAAELYENCIQVEYGQSPAEYRAEHGEYPVCVNMEDYK